MKDKKAAKLIIKRAKKHPELYTESEVRYAKAVRNVLKGRKKMQKEDSLKINQNEDGSFSMDWDRNDPNWKFLNGLTTKEIQSIIEQTIKEESNE